MSGRLNFLGQRLDHQLRSLSSTETNVREGNAEISVHGMFTLLELIKKMAISYFPIISIFLVLKGTGSRI